MVVDSVLCSLSFLFFVSLSRWGVDGEKGSRNSKRKRREEVDWRSENHFLPSDTRAF